MSEKEILPFHEWLAKTEPSLDWTPRHLKVLYDALERVTSGKTRRLIICMPPRHAKSETVTIRYSAWRLASDPRLKVIIGSYNQRLANKFSRSIRRILQNKIALAKDSKAVDEWETEKGGGVKAVGVGAGITGFGGGLVMIDDPVKSRAEAESETYRENVWEWFNDDIYTRLEPGAAIVLIQTRWHEDDLAGRLIKQGSQGGERWETIVLPALAEIDDPLKRRLGYALWPNRYPATYLKRVRNQLGSYSFSALYQQDPTPADNCLFKREWFSRKVRWAPEGLVWARGYDLAVSTKTHADYTASFRCAFDDENNLYIADGYRSRIEYPEQRRYVIDRLLKESDTIHGIESALHGQALVQDIRRETVSRGRTLWHIKASDDKRTRALAWVSLAEEGKVVLVEGGWHRDFLDEVCRFPHGKHDDQVDAVSLAIRILRDKQGKRSYGV